MMRGLRWVKVRYQLACIASCGFMIAYMLRVNLSVAIVAMVNTEESFHNNNAECIVIENRTSGQPKLPKETIFNWDKDEQGLILGSFFYGYLVTQIPGGWLAGKYGAKRLLGFGILCTAVFTLLTPLAAQLGVPVLVATRVLEGLGEGVTSPAMHAMWALWAPPAEKSKLVTLVTAGAQLGTVIGLPLAGVIISQLGWPYVFYIFGAIGIVWFIFWMLLTADNPADHKYISEEEKNYIITSIANTTTQDLITLKNTPWIEMMTSPALWGIICAHFCYNWGFYTLFTCLPTYMKEVLRIDISQDAFLSGLPYIFTSVFTLLAGFIVDTVRERQYISTSAARKIVNTIGDLVPAGCLLAVGYVGCNQSLVVSLLCIVGAFIGIAQSGFAVNHLDIAPKYAGTLMGITNTAGTIPGFLGPQVVGWLTSEHSTSKEWRSVFIISAEIYLFGVIIYLLLGQGVVQPWGIGTQRGRSDVQVDNPADE